MSRRFFARPGLGGADPWAALEELRRDLDELAGGAGAPPVPTSGVHPPINLYETREAWLLTAELPGVPPQSLEVSVTGNRVTLRGERRIEYPTEATSLHRRERASGIFRRSVELPAGIDADHAEASCRHGVLVLRIPKAPETKPRHITVSTG